jgi:hypothetical protein
MAETLSNGLEAHETALILCAKTHNTSDANPSDQRIKQAT